MRRFEMRYSLVLGLFLALSSWEVKGIPFCDPDARTTCGNGRCRIDSSGEYHCHCPSEAVGDNCQFRNPCNVVGPSVSVCANGGTCLVNVTTSAANAYCRCTVGYVGTLCEKLSRPQPSSCLSNPCVNGDCLVSNAFSSFTCRCRPGYTGTLCNQVDYCVRDPCKNGGRCYPKTKGFTCDCLPGYRNADCSQDVNECLSNPCQHGATCENSVGSFRCLCPVGYVGRVCESLYLPCSPDPCRNYGTCVQTSQRNYTCQCRPGFTGVNCERNIDDCPQKPCANGGTCSRGIESNRCQCLPQWTGRYCAEDVDECQQTQSPCSNGGTCLNRNGTFMCICMNGWTGARCDINIDDCVDRPCKYGGTCVDRVGSYLCRCPENKTGLQCQYDNQCGSNPCHSRALCETSPINGTYVCSCHPGWNGTDCTVDIDECKESALTPCEQGGTCVNTPGSFQCNCLQGFAGPRCEININECLSNPCQNEGSCLDKIGQFTCLCMDGFTGLLCETHMDECGSQPCANGATCLDRVGYFECNCQTGYTGITCEMKVPACQSNPCQYGGNCTEQSSGYGYTCRCPAGTSGDRCQDNNNRCAGNFCRNGASCSGVKDNFTCNCLSGFTGRECDVNIDDCVSFPCRNGGRCIDLVNAFRCDCTIGYTGTNCTTNIDECSSNPCVNRGTCTDDVNSYTCKCPDGYTGLRCELRANGCNSNPCQHGGTCSDQSGRYLCQCSPGFTGVNCETNRNDCAPNPCLNGGQCIDGIEGYRCNCPVPYTGPDCSTMVSPCQPSFCQNGGQCIPDASDTGFTCECSTGYRGTSCSEDVNECVIGNPCSNGGTCQNTYGSFNCKCPTGYTGQLCDVNPSDCVSGTCQNGGLCVDGLNNYTCQCVPGFSGYNCQTDIDECLSSPCANGATCQNYVNSYTCTCARGYSGTNCDINDNDCSSSLCLNGGTCDDGVDTYSCRCPSGYSGGHCEHLLTACDSNPCLNDGLCRVTGQTYACICTSGWQGQNCNTFVNWCSETTPVCQNGGRCTQTANEFQCACPLGWTGQRCDVTNVTCAVEAANRGKTVSDLCRNNGTCRNIGSSHECQCREGYSGSYCENKTRYCASQPCYNGATCTELESNFTCSCVPGFIGPDCRTNIDECSSSPCVNNGTCVDLVNSFHCSCLPGTSGVRCSDNLDDCRPGACLNGGTCMDKINGFACRCPPGFAGSNCQGDIDECLSSPCSGPGVLGCVQGVGAFSCLCQQGWTGAYCQAYMSPCVAGANPCLNGGECVDMGGPSSFSCVCSPGYGGPTCEKASCENNPCQNRGTCNMTGDRFVCQCPPDYTGATCDSVNNNIAVCDINSCKQKANNNRCDPECDAYLCNYDNYECSYQSNLYKDCAAITQGIPCYALINNGQCDSACNSETCLFDGWDCKNLTVCNPIYDAYCKSHHRDGHCDQGCNNEECGWDGLDCSGPDHNYAKDVLVIIVLVPYDAFVSDSTSFLRNLSLLLHGTLVIKKDDQGRDMIYQWPDETMERKKRGVDFWDFGDLFGRNKRSILTGTKFYARLDNANCKSQCFPDAEQAAEFLAQAVRQGYNPGYTLYSVGVEPDPLPPKPGSTPTVPVVVAMVAIVLVVVIVIVGVLEARKRRYGKAWFPEGFCAFPGRRIPDEQDPSKRVIPSSSSCSDAPGSGAESVTTVSESCCSDEDSIYHPRPKRRKSDKEDSREWTRIHLEAAGTIPKPALLAFTPPQNDLYEIRNINVRGPGGLTPLMLASMASAERSLTYDHSEGPASVITDLVNDGASIQSKTDHTGETPLHLAARYSRSDAAKRLLDAGADPNVQDNLGRTPLHSAVAADALGVFQILLRHRSTTVNARMKDGTTPLILAVRLAIEGMVEELINSDADVGATDEMGKTALHWSAAVNNMSAATLLLRHGANKDAQDDRSQTPLFIGAREGSRDVVILLLQNAASVDIPDHVDHLPRDVALDRCHHDIVQLLDNCSFNQAGDGGGMLGGVMSYMSQVPKNKQKRPSRKQRVAKESDCHKIEHCLQYPPHMSSPFVHLPMDGAKKSKRKPVVSGYGVPGHGMQGCLHATALGNVHENRSMEYPPAYDQTYQGRRQQYMAQANLSSLNGAYMDPAGLGTYHNKMMMVGGDGGPEQGWFPLESGQGQVTGGRENDMWMGHAFPDVTEAFNYDAFMCQPDGLTSYYQGKPGNVMDVLDPCNYGMYRQEGNIAMDDPPFPYGCLDDGFGNSHAPSLQLYDQALPHAAKTNQVQSPSGIQNSFPSGAQSNSSPSNNVFDPVRQSPQACAVAAAGGFNPCNIGKNPTLLDNPLDGPLLASFATNMQGFMHPGASSPPDNTHPRPTHTKPIKHVPPLSQFNFPQHAAVGDVPVPDTAPPSGAGTDPSRPGAQKASFPTPPSNHGHLSDTSPQQLPGCISRELYPTPSPDSLGPWSNSPTQSAKSDWSDKAKNSPHQPKAQQLQTMGGLVKEEPSFYV